MFGLRKSQVDERDYARYTIALPGMLLARRQRIKFILGELEKRHPCFSSRCCYQARTVLRGGRFVADVVVMDRARLAEYRARFGVRRRRVRTLSAALCAAVLCAGAFLLYRAFCAERSRDAAAYVSAEQPDAPALYERSAAGELAECLAAMQDAGITVSRVQAERSASGLSIGLACSGALPPAGSGDRIPAVLGQVSYAGNVPSYEALLLVPQAATVPYRGGAAQGDPCRFPASLREALLASGAVLRGESWQEQSISFSAGNALPEELLALLARGLREAGLEIARLELDMPASGLSCYLRLASAPAAELSSAELLLLLAEHAGLFHCAVPEAEALPQRAPVLAAVRQELPGQKIGVAAGGDGNRVTFYRTPAGKIIGVRE